MQKGTTRRAFLGQGIGGALALTGWARTLDRRIGASRRLPVDPVLVVLQVRGGWDGLSMLVPCEDEVYHAVRPKLALRRTDGLPVTGRPELRWHPAMAAWRELFDRGELAVVQNVSHTHPDLSHFDSEAKWHTADPAGAVRNEGWLMRLPPCGRRSDPGAESAQAQRPHAHGAGLLRTYCPTSSANLVA